MDGMKKKIFSDEEKLRRAEAVKQTIASFQLEGINTSPKMLALMERFIACEIEIDDVINYCLTD